MHVCILNMPIEYYSPVSGGAVATVIFEQAKHLVAWGHMVSVLTITNEDDIYNSGQVVQIFAGTRENLGIISKALAKVWTRTFAWDYPYYEHYARSFTAALKKLNPKPDLVVVHNDLIAPKLIKRAIPGVRVVLHLHNEQRTKRKDSASLLNCVDLIITVSDYIATWTRRQYGIDSRRLAVIMNGVNTILFHPRKDFQIAKDPLRVMYLGRTNHDKAPDLVADAVAACRDKGMRVHLVVVGGTWWYGNSQANENPFFRELKTKMQSAGAEYLGHLPRTRVAEELRQADIVCAPSRWNEPCSLVLTESMASGCAVVTSVRGGNRDVCGDAAVYVDPDVTGSVSFAIENLATKDELLADHKQRSLARSVQFCSEAVARQFEALYLELCQSNVSSYFS